MLLLSCTGARTASSITEPTSALSRLSVPDESLGVTKSWFHSFTQHEFKFDGVQAIVVVPKRAADGNPWVWRARFFGHEPQVDVALLKRGYHLAYVDVSGLYGAPKAVERWDRFHAYLVENHGFNQRVVLEGFSRGGLIVYNWASANPHKVMCIYADAPVVDFKSWPGGLGLGNGDPDRYLELLDAYELSAAEALDYRNNPIDNLRPLADAAIPILHVVGDADEIVPVSENSGVLSFRYSEYGGSIRVIHKKGVGHHPHSLRDPTPIVDFIVANTHFGIE